MSTQPYLRVLCDEQGRILFNMAPQGTLQGGPFCFHSPRGIIRSRFRWIRDPQSVRGKQVRGKYLAYCHEFAHPGTCLMDLYGQCRLLVKNMGCGLGEIGFKAKLGFAGYKLWNFGYSGYLTILNLSFFSSKIGLIMKYVIHRVAAMVKWSDTALSRVVPAVSITTNLLMGWSDRNRGGEMLGLRETVKIPLIQCGLAELPGTMETFYLYAVQYYDH